MLRATLYTKRDCQFCTAVRTELTRDGVSFTEINVTQNPERIPELLKLTGGKRVVPVIVDGDGIRVAPSGGTSF